MQKIGWIVAILCAVSWYASEIRLPGKVQRGPLAADTVWRRTADGWEKTNEWNFPIKKSPAVLHPGVMGLMIIAVSLSLGIAKNDPAE